MRGRSGARAVRGGLAALALVAALAACNRDPVAMTECIGNAPAVERTVDAAPPNCDPVLPGNEIPQPKAP